MTITGARRARATTQRNGLDGWTAAGIAGTVGVGALAAKAHNPLIALAAAGIGAATLFHAMQTHALPQPHVAITKSDTRPVTSNGHAHPFASEYIATAQHIDPTPGAPKPAAYEAMWKQDGPGWLGADGAISMRLPDGRMMWMFGDTFMGTVQGDRHLAPGWRFPRNTVVIQDNDTLTTLTRRSPQGFEASFLEPTAHPGQWYWPTASAVDGDKIHIMANRFRINPDVDPPWNWAQDGVDVITLNLDDFSHVTTRELVSGPSKAWGDGMVSDDTYTYIYGTAGNGFTRDASIMRFPKNDIDVAPQVWDGTSWNLDINSAQTVAGHDIANYSVERLTDGTYAMLYMQNFFGKELYVRNAPAPQGPWSEPRKIGERPAVPEGVMSYGLYIDKQGSTNDTLLVNYSVNGDESQFGIDWYRPRFTTVDQDDLVPSEPAAAG